MGKEGLQAGEVGSAGWVGYKVLICLGYKMLIFPCSQAAPEWEWTTPKADCQAPGPASPSQVRMACLYQHKAVMVNGARLIFPTAIASPQCSIFVLTALGLFV